jgi:hypothetical protein
LIGRLTRGGVLLRAIVLWSDAFDQPDVAFRSVSERGLVGGAVVGCGGLGEAVEFDDHGALVEAGFIGPGGRAADDEFAGGGGDGGAGEWA